MLLAFVFKASLVLGFGAIFVYYLGTLPLTKSRDGNKDAPKFDYLNYLPDSASHWLLWPPVC